MNENAAFIWAILLSDILFQGDPDLLDVIIKYIGALSHE